MWCVVWCRYGAAKRMAGNNEDGRARLASLAAAFSGGGANNKSPSPTPPVAPVGSIRSRASTFLASPPVASSASPAPAVTKPVATLAPTTPTTPLTATTTASGWDTPQQRGRSTTASPAPVATASPYARASISSTPPQRGGTTLQASTVSSPFVVNTRSPSPSVSGGGGGDDSSAAEKEPEKEIVFTPDIEYVKNPSHLDGLGDMCGLMYLEVPNILHNLAVRYERNEIYTNINKVLIAVNPYQFIDIYHSGVIRDYRARALKRHTDLLPHVFTVAQGAYHNLFHTLTNQSLIVCGESGSGKTESAKHLMRYLASSEIEQSPPTDGSSAAAPESQSSDVKSEPTGNTHSGVSIEKQVLDCNPILEAFGNAKTVLNNNSSRFGKFTKLVFNATERKIKGSFIETYLLEKSRLVKQEKGERNYHVFYQLCSKAVPEEMAKALHLEAGPPAFHYLNQSGTIDVDGMSDSEHMTVLINALSSIGMDSDLQLLLFRIVAGVLHLGNISFKALSADSCEIAAGSPSAAALGFAAELLGVDKALLSKRLTTRSIVVPPNQTITKELSVADAEAGRDTMTKALYNSLFGWIVRSMNKTLFTGIGNGSGSGSGGASAASGTTVITADGESKEMLWIGILDVFGFERFENNSFEQLCINFANERLQQFFNVRNISINQRAFSGATSAINVCACVRVW